MSTQHAAVTTFDFDFAQVLAPFAMRPGLHRLESGVQHFNPMAHASPLFAEKAAVWESSQAWHCAAGFNPAPALNGLAHQIATENVANNAHQCWTKCQNDTFFDLLGHGEAALCADTHPTDTPHFAQAARMLSMSFEQDFCVIDGHPASMHAGTVPLMCVCTPSHWAPEDKVGQSFAAIHTPVADNALIMRASEHLVRLATNGQSWERFVWTLSPSSRHDQHPKRHTRTPWPDGATAAEWAERCWFRAERQTLFPLLSQNSEPSGQAVFTIRVMLQPLLQAVDTPAKARRLHASLASMSPAVLAYKGLSSAQKPILAWLENNRLG